jgi:hypothetical protein
MLGSAYIRNPLSRQQKFDAGVLFESLLFFDKTHVFVDMGTLSRLIHDGFIDEFLSMIEEGRLSATYAPLLMGVRTHTANGLAKHTFSIFRHTPQGAAHDSLSTSKRFIARIVEDKTRAKALHKKFVQHVEMNDGHGEVGAIAISNDEIARPGVATELARRFLQNLDVPQRDVAATSIDVLRLSDDEFVLTVSGDLTAINEGLAARGMGPVKPANLVGPLINAHFDIAAAARYGSSFIGNDAVKAVVDFAMTRKIGASSTAFDNINALYAHLGFEMPRFRDAVNSGERSIAECRQLLAQADRFRNWKAGLNPDADLVKEMLKEKAQLGFLQRWPMKQVRFALFTGLGLAADAFLGTKGIATGIGVSSAVADSFVVDPLAAKWRPHYFIENGLRSFLDDTHE